jgi:hypothetical protein
MTLLDEQFDTLRLMQAGNELCITSMHLEIVAGHPKKKTCSGYTQHKLSLHAEGLLRSGRGPYFIATDCRARLLRLLFESLP